MSITTERTGSTAGSEGDHDARRTRHRALLNLALVAVVLVVSALLFLRGPAQATLHKPAATPHSSAMESLTGVRFSRVVVVGDGGLVTVFYVVIDPEKATRFQSDREHPPHLSSESHGGGTSHASIMRAGHLMRAGQTYYLVYENTRGAIRAGQEISIGYGGLTLRHVPVQ